MADKYLCSHCLKHVTATSAFRYRKHTGFDGEECMGAGEYVPPHQLDLGPVALDADPELPAEGRDMGTCRVCDRFIRLTSEGKYARHPTSIRGSLTCPGSFAFYKSVSDLPDIGEFKQVVDSFDDEFLPAPPRASPVVPVTDLGAMGDEIAARLKETFYAYDNRRAADNRSAQTHLGPSEIGTPCDRRLAMSLLQVPPTNPGGDGWAAFVGTCIHAGLAEMFLWANAGSGRYATEVPLTFPSKDVPRGTADLLDRTLFMLLDHKCQGQWSANKLRAKGPSPTYRVQLHTYGYGARLKGEQIDYVALISWPRDRSSLDDLYVHVERYDASIALDALKRVERIAAGVEGHPSVAGPLDIARQFPIDNSECKFCPYHAPGDKDFDRGCNGKE